MFLTNDVGAFVLAHKIRDRFAGHDGDDQLQNASAVACVFCGLIRRPVDVIRD